MFGLRQHGYFLVSFSSGKYGNKQFISFVTPLRDSLAEANKCQIYHLHGPFLTILNHSMVFIYFSNSDFICLFI